MKIKRDKFFIGLIVILILALILRIIIFQTITTGHSQDDYWFIRLGENFIKTGSFQLSQGYPYDLSQPLHPIMIGLSSYIFTNLFFAGKLISLIAGMLAIITTYVFWKKTDDKLVGLLAGFFVAFGVLSLWYSAAVREDALYAFLLIASLFFIYKSKDDNKFMPAAAVFIVLSAFTRWEGYLLIPVAVVSFLIWRRKEIFKKGGISLKPFKNRYFLIAFFIIVVPLFWWSLRSHNCCGSWIPGYGYQKQLAGGEGGAGLSYLTGIPNFIPWYFLIFIFLGLIVSLKKYKKYFPIYLYLIMSLFIHMKFRGHSDQILYVMPVLYGFLAMFIVYMKEKMENKKKIFAVILILFLLLFAVIGTYNGHTKAAKWGMRNDVIKEYGDWMKENTNNDDIVLVPDAIVYSYFAENRLVGYGQANVWIREYIKQKPISDATIAYAAFLSNNNIKYFVAYDSTMPWFHGNTEEFAKDYIQRSYIFLEKTVVLNPVRRFEKNNEEIILFEMSQTFN